MNQCQVYKMLTGHFYDEKKRLLERLRTDERYHYARSCKHCTDTADSFNRYMSTHCHVRQENIAGGLEDKLDRCKTCGLYERRLVVN